MFTRKVAEREEYKRKGNNSSKEGTALQGGKKAKLTEGTPNKGLEKKKNREGLPRIGETSDHSLAESREESGEGTKESG